MSSFHTAVLVHILEVLGTHSIQTAELKQVIGALRPLQNGQLVSNIHHHSQAHPITYPHPHTLTSSQPTYYYSVQKALSVMSHDITQEGAVPLYYFDLRTRHSVSDTPPPTVTPSHPHPLTSFSLQFISIPSLTSFPSSSALSFHTWVCLDYPQTSGRLTYSSARASRQTGGMVTRRRRILFR